MQCTAVYWVWVGMSRFVAQTRPVCSRVASAVWSASVRMRGQRFWRFDRHTDPAARVKYRITGFSFDPMKIRIFFGAGFPTVVAALLTHMSATENRHSGRVVKLRLHLRARALNSSGFAYPCYYSCKEM